MMAQFARLSVCALLLVSGCAYFEDRPKEHVVKIVSDLDTLRMYFQPRNLRIEPGDTVTWVNAANVDHNVITYPDGYPAGAARFESPYLSAVGDRWSHTFQIEGTYEYHCVPHLIMGMHGSVIVGRLSAVPEFHEPSTEEVTHYRNLLLEYFDGEQAEFHPRTERAVLPK